MRLFHITLLRPPGDGNHIAIVRTHPVAIAPMLAASRSPNDTPSRPARMAKSSSRRSDSEEGQSSVLPRYGRPARTGSSASEPLLIAPDLIMVLAVLPMIERKARSK